MIINKIFLAWRYLKYLFTARSGFGIHSPFVYSYYTEVIHGKEAGESLSAIEDLRASLLKQHNLIETTDFGSGAGMVNYKTRFRTISSVTRGSSIPPKYGKLLYRIARQTDPDDVLEIGTAMGISTLYIASAAPTSRIISMEGCAMIAEKAMENFSKIGRKNISLTMGNFDFILDETLEKFEKLDFVFIDGNHRREPTLEYFGKIITRTHKESVIIIHDIHSSKGMEIAWREICNHKKVSITIDLFHLGIVLFKEDIAKEDFILRF